MSLHINKTLQYRTKAEKAPYLVDVRMPHFCEKFHSRWRVWVVERKFHQRLKHFSGNSHKS